VLRDLLFTADKKQREGQANCLKLAISAIRAATVKCLSLLFVRKTLRPCRGVGDSWVRHIDPASREGASL
jgi:hypothetical protein